jgi:two-component system OmpR family response regulator
MPAMRRLLLIDDDELLGPPLAAFFRRHGLQMQHATRPSSALALLQGGGFDAAILDVMLPEMDGFELCRTIRRSADLATLPIVMLTARGDVMDRVVGLELGADDYLPKPFEPRELLARIQTVLRRVAPATPLAPQATPTDATGPASGVLRFEGLDIDLDRRSVQRQGQAVELTSTEFELLVLLAGTPGKVWHRDDILARLRGQPGQDIHSRAVDILVSRLRKKLEPLDAIHTLRNAGYLFAGVRV